MYAKLFEPFNIGKIKLSNRIVMLPIYTAYGSNRGYVTRAIIQHYREMASGGIAMLVTENVVVNSSQSHFGRLLRADNDMFLPGLSDLAEAIKSQGVVACCQINHAGRFAQVNQPVSASAIPAFDGHVPHTLSREGIEHVIGDYVSAALRVKEAGFDMVELHGGTGYLPVQFLSPRTNQRKDEYGGNLENRMRFFLELFGRLKDAVGDFPVGCRLMVDEWMDGGFTVDEGRILSRRLEEAGVSYLSVTAGTYESMFREDKVTLSQQEGYMVDLADMIKKEVSVPVIAAGRIASPSLAEEIFEEGKADLIGLGRVLIVDHLWPEKALGKGEINRCKPDCKVCLQLVMMQKPVICANWDTRRKIRYKNMTHEIETPMIFLKSFFQLIKVKLAAKVLK